MAPSYQTPTRATRQPYSRRLTTASGAVLAVGFAPGAWPGAIETTDVDQLVARLGRFAHATTICLPSDATEVRARTRTRVLVQVTPEHPSSIAASADAAVMLPTDAFAAAALIDGVTRRLSRVDTAAASRAATLATLDRGSLPLTPLARVTAAAATVVWSNEGAPRVMPSPESVFLTSAAGQAQVALSARLGVPLIAWAGEPMTYLALVPRPELWIGLAWCGARVLSPGLLADLRSLQARLA